MKLEIKNLTKKYEDLVAVNNLSLEIEEGMIYGIIGPNGAGKSTTLRCILGLLNYEGEIYFNNSLIKKDDVEFKKQIGYLESEVKIYKELTVKQMIDYTAKFYKSDLTERINYLVDYLELDVNKKIESLSLGNLKKIGIVITLMHSPNFIILDEPTSGLDPLMQNKFFDLLKEEKKRGATILFSTHILSDINKVCDRVSFLKNGTIIRTDDIANITHLDTVSVSIYSKDILKISEIYKDYIDKVEKDFLRIIFKGNINDLIKTLSKFDIKRLLIDELSIEDIFYHYYE